jgi:hypothetical protein
MRSRVQNIVLILLSLFVLAPARAADVKRFEVLKGMHYYQISRGASQLQTNNAYRFTTQVYADVVGDILGGSIYTPKIPRIDLLPDNDGDPFRFRDKFDDRFSLENNFPNGTYQLAIRGAHDGDRAMSFVLTGDGYPNPPNVNDYIGLQSFVYNQYNVISWGAFQGGTANDFIQLQIEDLSGNNVWETPDFGESGQLDGLATQTMVPAGTLSPGLIYVATIRFVKVLYNSHPNYPGAQGTVGYFTRTEFTIRPQATALDPMVDRLQIWRTLRYEQLFNGTRDVEEYPWEFNSKLDTVESNQVASVDLRIPGWTNSVAFTMDDPTQFEYSLAVLLEKPDFLLQFPNGNYTFDIRGTDGRALESVINVPAGDFPPAPTFRGYQNYTNHPAGQDLVVSWDAWVGATDRDFIRVELSDEGDKT